MLRLCVDKDARTSRVMTEIIWSLLIKKAALISRNVDRPYDRAIALLQHVNYNLLRCMTFIHPLDTIPPESLCFKELSETLNIIVLVRVRCPQVLYLF